MNKSADGPILSLITKYRKEINALGVSRLGLFGSLARGEQTPESDLQHILNKTS